MVRGQNGAGPWKIRLNPEPQIQTHMNVNVRLFKTSDEEPVVALWEACDLIRPWNDPFKDIQFCRESRHGEIFVGEEDDKLISSVMVGHDEHRGWLYYLAVSPPHRRWGLGREMVSAAEKWLKERDVPKAELMVHRENSPATQFYSRLGYQHEFRTVMSRHLDGRPKQVNNIRPETRHLPLIETTVTYLEMFSPLEALAVPAPPMKLQVLRLERPTTEYYLYLYDAVGSKWTWVNRKHMNKEELAKIIQDDLVEIFVIYIGGAPAGYAELDRRNKPDIELAYFGLVPEYIGLGLGRYFLDWAIRQAWSYGPKRVWVNTCTEDHPRALPLYQRLGFQVYAQEPATLDPNF